MVEGKLLLRIGKTEDSLEERILSPGDSCDIPPGTVHQMEALENCVIAEVSTPQLGDVVRLRDRYGREDSHSDRGDPSLGEPPSGCIGFDPAMRSSNETGSRG